MSRATHKPLALVALALALFTGGLLAQEPPGPPAGRDRPRQGMQRHRRAALERPLRQLLRRVAELPPHEQQRALESDEFFRRLPPRAQERFRERLAQFNAAPAERRRLMLEQLEQGGGVPPSQALFLRIAPLPPEEQERVLATDETFASLPPHARQRFRNRLGRYNAQPPEEQQRILERVERFSELPPERQEMIERRARRFASMSPEQRAQARNAFQAWRELAPERRQMLLDRLRRLQESSPAERRTLSEDEEFLVPLNEQERNLLHRLWELRETLPPLDRPPTP